LLWRSGHLEDWGKEHRRSIITVVLSVSIGLIADIPFVADFGWLLTHHDPAAVLTYLAVEAPLGWATGVMTFIMLRPRVLGATDREIMVSRCLLWSTLPVLLLQQLAFIRLGFRLDTLEVSGWFVLLIGLEMAGRTPAKLNMALQRLSNRGVLGPPEEVDKLRGGLRRAWRRSWAVTGVCVACALIGTSPWIGERSRGFHISTVGSLIPQLVFFGIAGAAAGSWLGRMVSYGRVLLKASLRKQGLDLQVMPSHPDGAGGLKPLGDYYLYQSLTASLPAIFLAIWVLLISLGGRNPPWGDYRPYLGQYLSLLRVAILFEVLVFVLPMSSIHGLMEEQKENCFLPEADSIFAAKTTDQAGLDNESDVEQEPTRKRAIELYKELDNAPTWPIDSSIRRRFTLRNLAFLVPLIGYLVRHTQFWQQLLHTLKGLG